MEEQSEQYLFERMPVPKAVATLAIPTIISQAVTMIYNLADTFFVGQLGDPLMVAAISLVSPWFNLLAALGNLFGLGGSSLISRMMVMPGYDMMWFGEESSGSNLNWDGFLCWTRLPEEMIVVSAQLTDWHETSARQAVELTEYFMEHFSADASRVYAAGYSAGGETMSQAVSMRPDLYAAYLHGASQWDGEYSPIAENGVAVYIFMAEHDEYYGSERAWSAYNSLHDAYVEAGWSEDQIADVLRIQTPDDTWFALHGVTGNYHGGGNVVFEESDILDWVISHTKFY